MKTVCVVLIAWFLACPLIVSAKRGAPPKVEPVVYEGTKYVAPNDDGRSVCVEAYNAATGKRQWKKEIYANIINPSLEEDVQWAFIRAMVIQKGNLLITDEKDRKYLLNLKTMEVTKQKA
jgi:outer membrane protein assembly factor BamB